MARKSLESFEKEDELKVFNVGGVELTEEQLQQLIEENKKFKSGKFIEDRIAEKHKPKNERDQVLIEGYKLILNGTINIF